MNSWLRAIDSATTEAEIVSQTRDFFALVHPRDLQPLPAECRDLRVDNDGDIARVKERLARGCAELRAHPSEFDRVRELLSYATRAADRLGEIRSHPM
jgi:hypothetical protein